MAAPVVMPMDLAPIMTFLRDEQVDVIRWPSEPPRSTSESRGMPVRAPSGPYEPPPGRARLRTRS
ncbi:hypothetical protein ACF1BB_14525 [Streptomyces griseoluteus]|uniref:hypothetical protein n=1 Tax=Streptomyces griseoluteus TaxID=29306 RepID=UPI0036FD8102